MKFALLYLLKNKDYNCSSG